MVLSFATDLCYVYIAYNAVLYNCRFPSYQFLGIGQVLFYLCFICVSIITVNAKWV